MSALADALVAAQRRALLAMEKAYVAGAHTEAQMYELLDGIGATDKVDQERLIASLTVIRDLGASLPAEPAAGPQEAADEPMSPKQADYIATLWAEKGVKPADRPDTTGLTKARASELINQLKAGTYHPSEWSIPF